MRIVRLAIACLLPLSSLVLPAAASAQVTREIHFINECRHAVRLFVYHQHGDGSYATHGWFDVAANTPYTMLTYANGNPLTHIDGRPIYYYAESLTGGHVWEGDTSVTFNGVNYQVTQGNLTMQSGRLQFGVNCNNDPGK